MNNSQWRNTCQKSVVQPTINCDNSESSANRSRRRHAKPWFMTSCPVDWTTATACCMALQRKQPNFLQSVLHSAARLVLRKRKFDSISSDMRDKLHWLAVKQRIEYKICMLVYKCRQNEAPAYLVEMLHPVVPSSKYNLRSESEKMYDFDIPRTWSVRSGPWSFFCVWSNSLEQSAILC